METFYWHDYETWGIKPAEDKPVQFAGVRTDHDFNTIGNPLDILCQPALDTVPDVDACLVTGLTPEHAQQNGVIERDFFAAIHRELAQPGTCTLGYNSLRFDDEFTRYGFYRNFYDPYAREWQHGNSRWDLIDMVRLCYAVRPEGIEWPLRDDGIVSFRLEQLTAANGLSHESAHDALSDVYATIGMAKLIKQKQPKLFDHVFAMRGKNAVSKALALGSQKPRLHISSRFGSQFACGSLVLPVVQHPVNKNEILCVDLRYSPEPLFDIPVAELAELLFTRVENLPSSIERIPLKSIHINRCPIVLTPNLVDEKVSERLSLDLEACEKHRQQLLSFSSLAEKLKSIAQEKTFDNTGKESEALLYDGFFSNNDKRLIDEIPQLSGRALADTTFAFEDRRLPDLLFRYRARNFPGELTTSDNEEWLDYCCEKLLSGNDDILQNALNRASQKLGESEENDKVISALISFLEEKKERLLAVVGA